MKISLIVSTLVLFCTCVFARRGNFDICRLRPRAGSCDENIQRWYYSAVERRCKPFLFGGCDGNYNNFASVGECKSFCMVERPQFCFLEPQYGPCDGRSVRRWFYNKRTRECEIFLSSGCKANKNYFISRDDCEHTCKA